MKSIVALHRNRALVVFILLVTLVSLLPTDAFAATYDQTWLIHAITDPQKRPFANIRVRYAFADSVKADRIFEVMTSLTYVDNENAHFDWIDFYDAAVHLRTSVEGTDLASASDSSRIKARPGQKYERTISVKAPETLGEYFVILTWKTLAPEGSAYDLTVDEGELTWDTGEDSSNLVKVTVVKPEAVLSVKLENVQEATIKIDGQDRTISNGLFTATFPLDGSHSVEVPAQLELGEGKRAIFEKWSDGDASNPRQLTLNDDLTLTAVYKVQYQLIVASDKGNPQGAGWYDAGTEAHFSVSSPTGFLIVDTLDHWQGDYTGSAPSGTVVMDGPKTVRALWRSDYIQLVVVLVVVVGGVGGAFAYSKRRKAPPAQKAIGMPSPTETYTPKPAPIEEPKPLEERPAIRAPAADGVKYCVHCGATIPSVVIFCTKCGRKQM